MCIISSFNYAYIAAFRLHPDLSENILGLYIFYETIFFIDMVLQFFKEFTSETSSIPVRNLEKISMNYLQNGFAYDFIAILPLQVLHLKNKRENLFFLIKLVRLEKGVRLMNVT